VPVTLIALIVLIVPLRQIVKAGRDIRNLRQAEAGERRVSELLRPLRAKDYIVFDDVITERGNIDHIVVGPGGVFALETKTYSLFGNARAFVRNDGVLVLGDKEAIGEPLKRARNAAALVSDELERDLRRKVWVEAVLVLLGWRVEPMTHDARAAVVNEKNLPEFRVPTRDTQQRRDSRDLFASGSQRAYLNGPSP
jgi:Nuclease-related domain